MAWYRAAVALALAAAALADVLDTEIYDDSPGDLELMYPEQNYMDTAEPGQRTKPRPWPASATPVRKHEDLRRMLLYKMMMALRNHDASPSFLPVPKWIPAGTVLVPPDAISYSPLPAPEVKRAADTLRAPARTRPQQKWKTKKGKAGSHHMICYFKLCAFRSSLST